MAKSKSILSGFIPAVDGNYETQLPKGMQMIHYTKIRPSTFNTFSIENIDRLAKDIAEDGLDANLLVRPIDDGNYEYELLAGERRFTAICQNIKSGAMEDEYILCKVKNMPDDREAVRRSIRNNTLAREITVSDKLASIEMLRKWYQKNREAGKIRNRIADDMGMSPSQIGVYEKVLNHSSPALREAIRDNNISIGIADKICDLSKTDQESFLHDYPNPDMHDVTAYKAQFVFDDGTESVLKETPVNNAAETIDKDTVYTADERSNEEYGEIDGQLTSAERIHNLAKQIEKDLGILSSWIWADDKFEKVRSQMSDASLSFSKLVIVISRIPK